MITATLCSTNGEEPWAANVAFEVQKSVWTTKLNTKYAHYKNLTQNNNIVVVYQTPSFEILAKGTASLSEPAVDEVSIATITLTWLRLVENGETADHADITEINEIIKSHC
jgi:hypothetical protein